MKRLLWLLPAALVLIGAFLLPSVLLQSSIQRIESKTYTSAPSTVWEGNGTALSMREKLSLFLKPNSTTQNYYDVGVVEQDEELRKRYYSELVRMQEDKILAPEVCVMLCTEDLVIFKGVLLDVELGETLSLYRMQYHDGSASVTMDAQSGKILMIVVSAYHLGLGEEAVWTLLGWHIENRPDWAGYYGAENAESYCDAGVMEENYYFYAQRFSLDGAEFGFTVCYNEYSQTITWRPNAPENVELLLTGERADAARESVG